MEKKHQFVVRLRRGQSAIVNVFFYSLNSFDRVRRGSLSLYPRGKSTPGSDSGWGFDPMPGVASKWPRLAGPFRGRILGSMGKFPNHAEFDQRGKKISAASGAGSGDADRFVLPPAGPADCLRFASGVCVPLCGRGSPPLFVPEFTLLRKLNALFTARCRLRRPPGCSTSRLSPLGSRR